MALDPFDRNSIFSIVGGPLVWAVHFLSVYALAAVSCARGVFDREVFGVGLVPLVGGAVTLAAVTLILNGVWVAGRLWRLESAPDHAPLDAPGRDSRRRFLAFASFLLCGISLLAVLWQSLPLVLVTSCR